MTEIETLSGYGLSEEKIAAFLGVSKSTFDRAAKKDNALSEIILKGRAKASSQVTQSAFNMAVSGKCPAMTIFWLKTRERWSAPKEHTVVEHKGLVKSEPATNPVLDEFKLLLEESKSVPALAALAATLSQSTDESVPTDS